MKDRIVIEGDEILREGLRLDERDHVGLPWLAGGGLVPKRPSTTSPGPVGPSNTAMRDFLLESGEQVLGGDPALDGDVGLHSTLAALRRRYGIADDITLTPTLIAQMVAKHEAERHRDAGEKDPFDQ